MANLPLVRGEPAANWLMVVVAGGRTEKLCRGDSTLSAVRVLFCESKTAGWTELMDEPSGGQSSAANRVLHPSSLLRKLDADGRQSSIWQTKFLRPPRTVLHVLPQAKLHADGRKSSIRWTKFLRPHRPHGCSRIETGQSYFFINLFGNSDRYYSLLRQTAMGADDAEGVFIWRNGFLLKHA